MSAAGDGATEGERANGDGAQRSLGKLVSSAKTDTLALLHDEIALFKAEMRTGVKKAGAGGTALAAAAVLLLFGIPVLSFAAAYGLHALGLALGWSFLIVFGAHVVLAAVAGAYGIAKMKKINKPERSLESARETAMVLSKFHQGQGDGHRPDGRAAASGVTRSTS